MEIPEQKRSLTTALGESFNRLDGLHVLAFGVLLFVSTIVVRLFVPAISGQTRIWDGYYTVLLSENSVEPERFAEVTERLGAITSESTTVHLSVIDEVVHVPLSEIETRLIPEDPRLDPYIARVGGYFSARDREVFYLPARLPPAISYLRALLLLRVSPSQLRLAEWHPALQTAALAVCALIITMIAIDARGARSAVFFGIVPIGLLSVQGGVWGGIAGSLLAAAWAALSDELIAALSSRIRDDRREKRQGNTGPRTTLSVGALAATIVLLPLHPRPATAVFSFVLCLCGLAGVVIASAGLQKSELRRREHRIFRPAYLLSRRYRPLPGQRVLGLVVACALLIALVDLVAVRRQELNLPAPHRLRGVTDFTWNDLDRLYYSETEAELPTVADYLAHVAYQQSIPVRGRYGFPTENETVSLSTFTQHDLVVEKSSRVVDTFGDRWYESALIEGRSAGVTRLLLSQPRPVVTVRIEWPAAPVIAGVVLCLVAGLACFVLGWSGNAASLTAAFFYDMRNLLRRRRHQIA